MRSLRDYQADGLDRTVAQLHTNPILVMPTGSGKTYTAATLVERLRRPTLWAVHRAELVDQAFQQLCGLGIRTGIIMAGHPENRFAEVHVASVQTLARRQNPANKDWLTIVDECHHAAAGSYQALFETGSPVVGLTATPFRLDGAGLGDFFGSLVVAATTQQLVDRGVLIRPRVFCAPAPQVDRLRMVAGDYSVADAGVAMDTAALVGNVVEQWLLRGIGRKTIVFAVNIAHSRHIVASFIAAGVAAAHVDGDTPVDERAAVLHKLRTGEITVISNVGLFTEGWDLPALSCGIMARPTASLGLHQQMCGRLTRCADGKSDAVILDHAGNHLRHGEITREIEYSLDSKARAAASPALGVRTCLKCYCMFPVTEWVCPQCGQSARPPAPPIVHTPGDLREFLDHSFAGREREWAKIEGLRTRMNFPEGWSVKEYLRLFSAYPVLVGRRLIDVDRASVADQAAIWADIDVRRRGLGYDRGWTDYRFKEIFSRWPSGEVRDTHAKVRVAQAVASKGERVWTGKAKVRGVDQPPSRPGSAENPYSEERQRAEAQAQRPWERSPSPASRQTAAAALLIVCAEAEALPAEVVRNLRLRQKVYRQAAKNYHPDTGGDPAIMVKINQALAVLEEEDDIPF